MCECAVYEEECMSVKLRIATAGGAASQDWGRLANLGGEDWEGISRAVGEPRTEIAGALQVGSTWDLGRSL